MGISGLLPLLKSIHKPCSLKKFSGQTIGVDAYGWLHRGTAACAIDLALKKPTTKFVDFAMHRVRMLIHFGITPYIVFDGDYLPSKGGTEVERAEKRKEGKRLGLELLKVGKTSQAQLELQKAVDVTPEMARMLIEELKHHNIQYVVAPYEADSQLAYLERQGIINGILSEDSDLLVFGAKCLITKLDKYGECVEINRNHFTACREISLAGWSDADFRRMAMLSGCDYLPGIGKMGLKTAYRMLRKHKTVEKVVKAAQFEAQFKVAPGYLESFKQAENTFLYQWVFCPSSNKVVNLTTPEQGIDVSTMPYIGSEVRAEIAIGVANGDLHPHTKEPIVIATAERSRSKPLQSAPKQVLAQTPDLKKSKSIESFFKPKRTPLAELDPNIFTPSPSQQVLLEQHRNTTWVPAMAPPSLSQPRASLTRTAPQPVRRTVSESIGRRSAPHPSKRQRLCAATVDTPIQAKDQGERSRFFNHSVADPSPSLRATMDKNKHKSKHDFELYSDDSFDEAIAELADFEEAVVRPKKKKKMAIFKEEDLRSSVNSIESQSTTISTSITDPSQNSIGTLTPATSFGSPAPDNEETPFSATLSSQVQSLRSKFSYNRHTTPERGTSRLSMSQSISHIPKDPASDTSSHRARVDTTPCASSTKSARKTARREDESTELEDSAWVALEAEVIVAASETEVIPCSSPVQSGVTDRVPLRGSEDMFVPDSEAESDSSPQKPVLNLDRFAFCG